MDHQDNIATLQCSGTEESTVADSRYLGIGNLVKASSGVESLTNPIEMDNLVDSTVTVSSPMEYVDNVIGSSNERGGQQNLGSLFQLSLRPKDSGSEMSTSGFDPLKSLCIRAQNKSNDHTLNQSSSMDEKLLQGGQKHLIERMSSLQADTEVPRISPGKRNCFATWSADDEGKEFEDYVKEYQENINTFMQIYDEVSMNQTNEEITDPEVQKRMLKNRAMFRFADTRQPRRPPFKYVRLSDINPFA